MISATSESGSLDRYVVLEYLAEGGMGAIFLGKKLGAGGFEKPVVLKQLLPEFTSQREFIDLFLNEARLSATLDHANIIHTIDLVTAGDEHFIVMEYLAGADLRTLLQKSKRRHCRFSPGAGIYIAREVLSALSYAHAKRGQDGQPLKLIHRDVSPSNILISHNGEVKLTDFGIAKVANHNSVFYRVKGKIGYMSPEQARSETLDNRSDLYSLAVCLYEVLTGERLFVHAGLTTSPDEIYNQPIPRLSQKIPGIPPAFDEVMFKALAIDPDQRYQSAGTFQEALLRVAHQAGMMMSAPGLARHLLDVAGPVERWRDLEGDEDVPSMFEEYAEGTEKIDINEIDDDARGPAPAIDLPNPPTLQEQARREQRAAASMTNLERFRGLELTSMIRLPDAPQGSQPLVDLDDFGPASPAMSREAMPLADDTVGFRPDQVNLADPFSSDPPQPPPGLTHGSALSVTRSPDRARSGPLSGVIRLDQRRSRRSWPIWLLIALAGLGTAAAVGLTGPRLDLSQLPTHVGTTEAAAPTADTAEAAAPAADTTEPTEP
ncbi:serine/threonine protein kinase [Haliangium sp.]|uniref:serine/threonine protein kinase n=1 Tax=Haliangium sp. TaxID=2663208 RepID=UPI003D0C9A7D